MAEMEKVEMSFEDCMASGNRDTMLRLGKQYALGYGVNRDSERAEQLISTSADKENREARVLMDFINKWRNEEKMMLCRLPKTCILYHF